MNTKKHQDECPDCSGDGFFWEVEPGRGYDPYSHTEPDLQPVKMGCDRCGGSGKITERPTSQQYNGELMEIYVVYRDRMDKHDRKAYFNWMKTLARNYRKAGKRAHNRLFEFRVNCMKAAGVPDEEMPF